tara:strand:- start:644 stop:1078 length:435 start_codon:yes stop_codon:yes gene_type:complete
MKVLTTSSGEQTITFIPRYDVSAGRLLIYNKNTRETEVVEATFSQQDGYTVATAVFNMNEAYRYSLTVISNIVDFEDRVNIDFGTLEAASCVDTYLYNDGNEYYVIYRDTILCTDQQEYDKYDIQKGEYIQAETSDNGYVVVKD